jgi:hypothetical protein
MTIEIKLVDRYEDEVFKDLVTKHLESDRVFIPAWDISQAGDETFQSSGKTVRIGAFDNGVLIGLSWGKAESKARFITHMSLVLPEYRKKGLYSGMLDLLLRNTKEFDEIDSCHHIFNNDIISLKLRKGFYIVGTDHCVPIGPRIRLRYFNNQKLFEFMKFRVGLIDQPSL